MRRKAFRVVLIAMAGCAGLVAAGVAPAAAATGTWGVAEEVPGIAAANPGGPAPGAQVSAVSCTSPGNCEAAGYYTDSGFNQQAFTAAQASGSWQSGQELVISSGWSGAELLTESCRSAGDCSAGGTFFAGGTSAPEGLLATEANGSWAVEQVPGTGPNNTLHDADILTVSCASAGNCSAGGYFINGSDDSEALVVNQINGTWGTAEEVPGTATLNHGNAEVTSVSCASAGNCSAGGYYIDSSGAAQQAFVVSETSGAWGKAKEVPGTASLNTSGNAQVNTVSCASAGNCSAGGFYKNTSTGTQAFVVAEKSGTWGEAEELPGSGALNSGGAAVTSISCVSAGNCAAGGYYGNTFSHQAMVATQTSGTWAKAKKVPGSGSLNAGANAEITSVSCASAGNCGAGGFYTDSAGHAQALVVSQGSGTWGQAKEVPGSAGLNAGGSAEVLSVSCTGPVNCSAGGYYTDSAGVQQAFVDSET